MLLALILVLGIAAGIVGGVVGFGATVMLMPLLVFTFGPKETIPIIAIASIMANLARAAVWWREIDWRVNGVYCATAVPAAAFGANLLVQLDGRVVEGTLGLFLILMVPARRWLIARGLTMTLWGMGMVGAAIGFLTGLVASTGPLNTPFFLAYGLTKGAFLATEAVGSAAVSTTKSLVFRNLGALPLETIASGMMVGTSLMIGSWLAKHIVRRIEAQQFRTLLEVMMAFAGASMIWSALRMG